MVRFIFSFLLILSSALNGSELLDFLKNQSGVMVKEIEPLVGFNEAYEIGFSQLSDHRGGRKRFTQKIFLDHIDRDRPVLLQTCGYDLPWHRKHDINNYMELNQIMVEHRYFGNSIPDRRDWSYLTTWQAASDHHRVVELFKKFYRGKWVSSGVSKGGIASLMHRYYYPDDIDCTLAYVAPILLGDIDMRIPSYIDNLTISNGGERIYQFQRECLLEIEELKKIAEGVYHQKDFDISIDDALVWSIIEYPIMFWFRNSSLDIVPKFGATPYQLFSGLEEVAPLRLMNRSRIGFMKPLLYQQFTELGNYGYSISNLSELVDRRDLDIEVIRPEESKGIPFNYNLMMDLLDYLRFEADNIIYLYGENDAWSGGMVDPSDRVNSKQFVLEGYAHSFKLKDFEQEERDEIIESISDWLK